MNNSENSTIALVTGANRGIGLEVARQLAEKQITVFFASRDLNAGQKAAEKLIQEGLKVIPCQLDVTDIESINRLVKQIEQRFSKLDITKRNCANFKQKLSRSRCFLALIPARQPDRYIRSCCLTRSHQIPSQKQCLLHLFPYQSVLIH